MKLCSCVTQLKQKFHTAILNLMQTCRSHIIWFWEKLNINKYAREMYLQLSKVWQLNAIRVLCYVSSRKNRFLTLNVNRRIT